MTLRAINGTFINFEYTLWNKKSPINCTTWLPSTSLYYTMFKKMTEFGPDSGGRVKVTLYEQYSSVFYIFGKLEFTNI